MTSPPFLKPGDTIYLLSTARYASLKDVEPMKVWLEDSGFNVLIGESIGPVYHQFAGDDALRNRDFQTAIDHPKVKAIWCARGGYGSVRMMENISLKALNTHPKWLIGFSDVTALHGQFQNHQFASIHSWMAVQFPNITEQAKQHTLALIKGEPTVIHFPSHSLNSTNHLEGTMVGGNLSILYSMLGSCDLPKAPANGILFIEEIDEYLYHIDRMMHGLRRAGYLQQFEAIAVGGLTDMNDHQIPFGWNAEQIMSNHARKLGIEVIFNLPVGHINDHHAIVLGGKVKVEKKGMEMVLEIL